MDDHHGILSPNLAMADLKKLDSIAVLCDTAGMTYPGGKSADGVYQQIINQIPPHRVYIEPFLGGGAVLLHKRPAIASIAIDSDGNVVEKFQDLIAKNSDTVPPGTIVKNGDAISFLRSYEFKGDEFVYADPPYLMSTRTSKRKLYRVEFGDEDQHIQLLDVLNSLPCMVAISGYWSSLYENKLSGWRSINYKTTKRSGEVATEYLWMNYPEPKELHDYRYLGQNFRQRERIKRIKTRWLARLARMDPLERFAMLSSIAEFADAGHQLASSKTAI